MENCKIILDNFTFFNSTGFYLSTKQNLTKLNQMYVRFFKILPWFDIETNVSKLLNYLNIFYLISQYWVQKISSK
jgi:hypothetical protein